MEVEPTQDRMKDKVLGSFAKSWLNRVAFQTVMTLVLGGILACIAFGIMAAPESLIPAQTKPWLYIGSFACLMSLLMVGIVVWVLTSNKRIYAQFDESFLQLGLTRSRYLIRGFQYRGTYRGRELNVYYRYAGGRYLRTPNLDFSLAGAFRTRFGLGTESALGRMGAALLKQQHLDPGDPVYAELLIYAEDETWSRRLLADPQARAILVRLAGKDNPGVRAVNVGPESVRFLLRHFTFDVVTPEAVRQWADDLWNLARLAEDLPPPAQTAVATKWDRADYAAPSKVLVPALVITVALVLAMVVCSACIISVGILLGEF